MKKVWLNKIEYSIKKLLPKVILEQKQFYNNTKHTDESRTLDRELKIKLEEHKNLMINNGENISILSEKAREIESLKLKLKTIHPHYQSLQEIETLSFEEIKNTLTKDEVFFQPVLTLFGIVTILISNHHISIKHKYLDTSNLKNMAEKYSLYMQLSSDSSQKDIDQAIKGISQEVASDLLEFLELNSVDRIFYIPEFELKMFSLVVCCNDNIQIPEKTASIINLIDSSALLTFNRTNTITGVANRIIGNPYDPILKKISTWLHASENKLFMNIDNTLNNLDNLKDITEKNTNINTISIYAHGVPDPRANKTDGAKGIQGDNRVFELKEVFDYLPSMQNLILISCNTGSPNYKFVEEASGTWSTLFEKFNGNIISCRWDVSAEETIKLLQELYKQSMENNISIDKALLIAQKKLRETKKHPEYWAGIEFWIN